MRRRFTLLVILLSLPLFSEPAEIMYYNFFGDYLSERSFQIDVDIPNISLQEIHSILQSRRESKYPIDADLVIIGYGQRRYPEVFFAATSFINYEIPLNMALSHQPERVPDGKWYIYYIDRSLSGYVRARQDHHWSSPFRWLAQIGLQDLHYFGPFLNARL